MRMLTSLLLASCLIAMGTGCSISESVSKSISSPFEWSSASSGSSSASSAARGEAYRNDVRDYTAAYIQSGGEYANFSRGLGIIASKHGVSDWESDNDTWIGIGQGLKKAGVTTAQLAVWKTNLTNGDAQKASAMQKGYDSVAQ